MGDVREGGNERTPDRIRQNAVNYCSVAVILRVGRWRALVVVLVLYSSGGFLGTKVWQRCEELMLCP